MQWLSEAGYLVAICKDGRSASSAGGGGHPAARPRIEAGLVLPSDLRVRAGCAVSNQDMVGPSSQLRQCAVSRPWMSAALGGHCRLVEDQAAVHNAA